MRRLGLVLTLSVLAASCGGGGSGDTLVVIKIERGNAAGVVKRIDLDLTLAGRGMAADSLADGGQEIKLPTSALIGIRSGAGMLTVHAKAFGDGTTVLGEGSAAGTVTRGQTTTVTITFGMDVVDVDGGTGDGGGDGGGQPALAIDPDDHDFGSVQQGATSPVVQFTVRNSGTAATNPLTVAVTGGSGASFVRGADTCMGQALAAGASCTIDVTFMPAVGVTQVGALLDVSAGAGVATSATLRGTGEPRGSLVIAALSKDFGAVPVNTLTPAEVFTVSSPGQATGMLSVRLTGNDIDQFTTGSDTCSGMMLPADGMCTLSVRFLPTSGGAKAASLVVSGMPGGSAVATLVGSGQQPAHLSVSPSMADFGSVVVGTPSSATTFTFTNDGDQTTTALSTQLPTAEFTVVSSTCTGTLAKDASCTISISLAATTRGVKMSTLSVSATQGGMASVDLNGTAQNPAQLSLTPADGMFGSVVIGNVSTVSFGLSNTGEVTSGAPGVTIAGTDMSQFTISTNTCTVPLAPNGSCMILLTFTPTSPGSKVATMTVMGTPGGTLTANLTGTGVPVGELRITPTGNNFMGVLVGSQSGVTTFTVTNTGGAPSGTISTSLSGGAASEFSLSADNCNGVALAAGATCTLGARLSPTSPGGKTDSIVISASPGGMAAAAVTGSGLAPAHLAISPQSQSFVATAVGGTSAVQSFMVTNTGDVVSGAVSAVLSGVNANQFGIMTNGCTSTLAPGASCTVVLVFHPTSGGAKSASLDASGTPGGTSSSVLSGTGLTPVALTVTPTPATFGTVLVGSSGAPQSFTVRNTGDVTSAPLTVTTTGPFAITAGNCAGMTLASNASCTVSVRFSPVARGAGAGTLVASDGSVSGTATLSGTGSDAVLMVAPSPYDFGNVIIGAGATQTFTVTNSGDATSGPITLAVSGTNMGELVLSGGTCTSGTTTLAPAASCTKVVTFTPGALGARSATLTVSGSPGGTAMSLLSGTGINPGMLTISPTTHDFGAVVLGSSSATQSFTVTNSGGGATGMLAVTLAAPYSIVTNTCTGTLAGGGGTCTVSAKFTPTVRSSVGGSLQVGDGTTSTSASLSGQGTDAILSVTPSPWPFGGVVLGGNTTKTFTVTNTGDATSGAVALAISGTNATDFTLSGGTCTSGTTTLAPGGSCTKVVTFAPGGAGARGPAILTASASPGGSSTSSLTGTGLTPAALTLTPAPVSFGSVLVGSTSAAQNYTITNTGQVATAALSASVTGQYTIATNGCAGVMLAPSGTCMISVTFAPTSTGTQNGVVTVTDGTASVPGNLTGTGINAVLTLAISPTTFASTPTGSSATATATVSNTGGATSGPVTLAISGTNAGDFSLSGGTCTSGTTTLTAGSSCTKTVTFTPGATGSRSGTLTVSASPGGAPSVGLAGTGLTPALLNLPTSQSFGTTAPGTPVTQTIVLTNSGQGTSTAITLSIGSALPAGDTSFSILTPIAGDCTSGTTTLAGGASCNVRVQFNPGTSGNKSATLTASATKGGSDSAALTGGGSAPATLSVTVTTNNFGNVNQGSSLTAFSWVISNTGDVATSVPIVTTTGSNPGDFTSSGCTTAIAAQSTCTLSVTFTPSAGGTRTATKTVSAGAAGSVSLSATGVGNYRVTYTKSGTGAGTVTSSPAGLSCGASCVGNFAPGTSVTFSARATNSASGYYFQSWSGACSGVINDCGPMTINADTAITAQFTVQPNNLVFVSSIPLAATLGGAAAYDTQCNTLASAAGINNASSGGTGFTAWMSDGGSNVISRIGSARGFMRLDGAPFGDDIAGITTQFSEKIFNVLNVDENGRGGIIATPWTGTNANGSTASTHCSNWSTTAGTGQHGQTNAAKGNFAGFLGTNCTNTNRVFCFGKTHSNALTPSQPVGKRIYLVDMPANSGIAGANNACNAAANKPSGTGTAIALLPVFGPPAHSAGSLLSAGTTYYRTDNIVVGTGAQIAAGNPVSGIWQYGNGHYGSTFQIVTGTSTVSGLPPTLASTCSDWTVTGSGAGGFGGDDSYATSAFWSLYSGTPCGNSSWPIYCIEQ